MDITVSSLDPIDLPNASPLWHEAFGVEDEPEPPGPGRRFWQVSEDGRRAAALGVVREFETWFGQHRVPTAGVAGITVAAEHRGGGHLKPLFGAMLADARERGDLLSCLYPTANGIYRGFGYAPVAYLDHIEVPTHLLMVGGDAAPVRRAAPDDLPLIAETYLQWSQQHRGPLTRDGISFPDPTKLFTGDATGVTLAESSPGTVTGYAIWHRGKGYGDGSEMAVRELVALDRPSLVGLLRTLGSFAPVTPVTVIRSAGARDWIDLLRSDQTKIRNRATYMAAVLDVDALTTLSPSPALTADLPLVWNDDAFVVSVADGTVRVAPGSARKDARVVDDAALVRTLFGSADSATLRRLGHLSGPTDDDPTWDALTAAPSAAIYDYY